MWIDNKIYREDMQSVAECKCIDWDKIAGKTVLVTGATGLIGSTLIDSLLYADTTIGLNIRIVALVRNVEKARIKFKKQLLDSNNLEFVEGTVEDLPEFDMDIGYIVHGASPTASNFFVEKPVETIKISVQGTIKLLDLAVKKHVKGFIYLSSMEVYGAPHTDDVIFETQGTTVDTMSVRSCYPEAKRLCESLCASYASEYAVPAMVVRLAQTFGAGVNIYEDNRVFAEFARCAIDGKDIVLQTAGTSKRCYLYTAEAVSAILTVLLYGKVGEAYNAANKGTYCSIVEMAKLVACKIAKYKINVCIPTEGKHEKKFSPPHNLNLDTSKLEKLGWKAEVDLADMYTRMIGRI